MRWTHCAGAVVALAWLTLQSRADNIALNTWDLSYYHISGTDVDKGFAPGTHTETGNFVLGASGQFSLGYDLQTDHFAVDFKQAWQNAQAGSGLGPGIHLFFTALDDLYYRIGGDFSVDDNGGHNAGVLTTLRSVTTGVVGPSTVVTKELLYSDSQNSNGAADPRFVLGPKGATGRLLKGEKYAFDFSAGVSSINGGTSGSGSGQMLFEFSREPLAQVVPLPAAAWGGLALLGGLGVTKRTRRKRDATTSVAY